MLNKNDLSNLRRAPFVTNTSMIKSEPLNPLLDSV